MNIERVLYCLPVRKTDDTAEAPNGLELRWRNGGQESLNRVVRPDVLRTWKEAESGRADGLPTVVCSIFRIDRRLRNLCFDVCSIHRG